MKRDTITVTGSDAASYLQGQISQDVDALAEGDTAWSLVLHPTGKMVALFRIHRVGADDFLLDVDGGHAEALLARLRRFVLRTAVTFEESEVRIPVPMEWPGTEDPNDERQRILAGMPRMGAELTDDTIPGEAGQRMIELAVSFTKGCYTGQELVARIDSRGGNVPRPIRVLVAEGPIAVGDSVTVDGATVGEVTSTAGDVGLATVMRKVQLGDAVSVGVTSAVITKPVES
ncbi:MAG: folate-binding protein YgfZ [Acidimicrobiaceae bacterium]|jgi:tRNA-modifying protein YgfZ|nr:folate-binding protein YgfZ [Acidimicrobiaceae bacterium]MBT5580888.1 folate-binding protein YgfZ [Acidimicrobiaceae bacterium]MBT5848870.1 folate-binding protein YgfZ [Acidimicrobiaceae bacterium]